MAAQCILALGAGIAAFVLAFDRHGFDDNGLVFIDETELGLVGCCKGGKGIVDGAVGKDDGQRGVCAVIAQMQKRAPFHGIVRNLLFTQFGVGGLCQPVDQSGDLLGRFFCQWFDERLLARGKQGCKADAIGREKSGKRVYQNGFHAQRVGDKTGVLPARAAKTIEQVAGHIVAALHGNFLDGICHVLHGDGDETLGNLFGGLSATHNCCKFGKFVMHDLCVEPFILTGPENGREIVRLQLAEHHIGIGDSQRSAAAIAGRAWIGAGRIRTGAETAGLIVQNGPATCRHSVNLHHWRADAHAGHFGVEGAFVFAIKMRDIGRRAAHVKADHLIEAGQLRCFHHADNAAGRS